MTLPKIIICMDGTFRLGMVNQHKHLLKPGDQCIGGGYYHFDFVSIKGSFDLEITAALLRHGCKSPVSFKDFYHTAKKRRCVNRFSDLIRT